MSKYLARMIAQLVAAVYGAALAACGLVAYLLEGFGSGANVLSGIGWGVAGFFTLRAVANAKEFVAALEQKFDTQKTEEVDAH